MLAAPSQSALSIDHVISAGTREDMPASLAARTALPVITEHYPSELPVDVWEVIADYSVRDVVFNLRAVNDIVRQGAERGIHHITLGGGRDIEDFANSRNFADLRTMSIRHCNDADLVFLGNALSNRSDPPLTLEIDQTSHFGSTATAFIGLRNVNLSALHLRCNSITPGFAAGLIQLPFPISITCVHNARADRLSLLLASTIPTLTHLSLSPFSHFTDDMARAFASHSALERLEYVNPGLLTDRGVRALSHIPHLRELTLSGMNCSISIWTAHALARCRQLEQLSITKPFDVLHEAIVEALAASASLRTLKVAISAGTRHLALMENLKTLHLSGPTACRDALNVTRDDAALFIDNNGLRELRISCVNFEDGTLDLLANAFATQTHDQSGNPINTELGTFTGFR